MSEQSYASEVVIAGGGLAGILTAFELLGKGKKVLLIEKSTKESFGGLAKLSFGGVCMVGTPYQKKTGIRDTPDIAHQDWLNFADFGDGPEWDWPRKWSRVYCEQSVEDIFLPLDSKGIEFLPIVNWPERGLFKPGNSVPRWHITWGTGHEIAVKCVAALEGHAKRGNLEILFEHEVSDIEMTDGRATGVTGKSMIDGSGYRATAEHVVIASGGICGGDLSKVRANWFKPWGEPPEILLNGAHEYADGMLQDRVLAHGGNVTHLDKQWHYATGVHRPGNKRPDDGVSLVPPRSALWMNAHGRRIGPMPLMGYTDTRYVVEQVCQQPGKYSWQVLNQTIAAKELAVSGCDYMTAFRTKNKAMLIKHVLFGNTELVDRLIREIPEDFVVGQNLDELMGKMDERNLHDMKIDRAGMKADIDAYDAQIDRGPKYFNDDQLRRIMNFRTYRGDKIRTCKYQKILDPKAGPLIAIREFIMARKSLGGIQTDLACRVLEQDGATPIPGLYAVGEAAGFGGGGIHGHGSLEGTFLGSCVLTGRVAGRSIAAG